jgi:hypothetical protein
MTGSCTRPVSLSFDHTADGGVPRGRVDSAGPSAAAEGTPGKGRSWASRPIWTHAPFRRGRAGCCALIRRGHRRRWVDSAGVTAMAPVILGRCLRTRDIRCLGLPMSMAVVGSRRDVQQEETPPTGGASRVATSRVAASRVAANPAARGDSLVIGRTPLGNPGADTDDLHASVGHPGHRGARDHRRPDNHLDRRDTGHPGWLGHPRSDGSGNADRHRRLRGHHRDHAVGAQQAALSHWAPPGPATARTPRSADNRSVRTRCPPRSSRDCGTP